MTGRFLDDDDTLDPDDIDELLDDDATIFGQDVTILAPRATGQPPAEEKPEPPPESQPPDPTIARNQPRRRQFLTIGLTAILTAAVTVLLVRTMVDSAPVDTPTTGVTTMATTSPTLTTSSVAGVDSAPVDTPTTGVTPTVTTAAAPTSGAGATTVTVVAAPTTTPDTDYRFVYTLEGTLYIHNLNAGRAAQVIDVWAEKGSSGTGNEAVESYWVDSAKLSPDGEHLAFRTSDDLLYMYPMNAGPSELVAHGVWGLLLAYAVWSPDGLHLAYNADDQSGDRELHVYNVITGQREQLASYSGGEVWSYDWSRDGRFLAYAAPVDDGYEVHIYDMSTGISEEVARLWDERVYSVRWSPDSTYVAYATEKYYDDLDDLYVYNLNTGSLDQIGTNFNYSYSYDWSRDGTYLAYSNSPSGSGMEGNSAVHIYDLGAHTADQIAQYETGDTLLCCVVAWSPDGTHLAYTSPEDDGYILHIHNLNTDRSERMVYDPMSDESSYYYYPRVSWSPGGNYIVYGDWSNLDAVVNVRDLNTGGSARFTGGTRSFDWSWDGVYLAYMKCAIRDDYEDYTDPCEIYIYSSPTGSVERVTGLRRHSSFIGWLPPA